MRLINPGRCQRDVVTDFKIPEHALAYFPSPALTNSGKFVDDAKSCFRIMSPDRDASRFASSVRLAENHLYLLEGDRIVWSAPVGTGTGFRLEADGRAGEFDTPRGVFRIQRKEKDPVWIKPEWAYVKEGKPVPPIDSPERRDEGMLGTSALYIGYELALHGTSSPDLVLHPDPEARRVSHGCIRLTNEDARTLYHLVDVGTPVMIY